MDLTTYVISANSSIDLIYTVDVPLGTMEGNYDNSVTASVETLTTSPVSASVMITAPADLELTKNVSDATPEVGDTVTYTIEITNNGPDTATNVMITDVVPAGLSYNTGSIMGPGANDSDPSGGGLTWTIPSMLLNDVVMLTFTATVTGTGIINNIAEITSSDQPDPDSTPNNGDIDEDDQDEVCISVPIPLCSDFTITVTSGLNNYQWFKDGVLIMGADSNSYVVTMTGTYTFTAEDDEGCEVVSACPSIFEECPCGECTITGPDGPVCPGTTNI